MSAKKAILCEYRFVATQCPHELKSPSMVSVVEGNLRAGVHEASKECGTHTVDGKSNAGRFDLEVFVNCVLHLI